MKIKVKVVEKKNLKKEKEIEREEQDEKLHNDNWNKAGYTANISCGRVGRGGNALFHTFKLDHHGPTNQPTDRPMDGRTKPLIESLVRD